MEVISSSALEVFTPLESDVRGREGTLFPFSGKKRPEGTAPQVPDLVLPRRRKDLRLAQLWLLMKAEVVRRQKPIWGKLKFSKLLSW